MKCVERSVQSLAIFVLVAGIGGATATRSAETATGEAIPIGAVLSLTGPGAGLGQPERNGILLAEKIINARGGVAGHPIRIMIEDDASKADIAKSKAEKLIFDQKAIAMLGPSLTASTGAIGSISNSEGMAEVTFTGLGPPIEQTYKSLYHVLPPQILNARAMLEFATKALKAKKIGVLHDTGYGQVVTNSINQIKNEYGVDLVAVEKFEVGATDTSTQAAKVRAAEPDVVFVIATSPVPFRNARQVKIAQPIISAIGSASYDYVRGMGDFADDIVFPEFLVGEDPEPQQVEFVKLYKQEYKTVPKNFEAAGYDSVNAVAAAIEKAGADMKPASVAAALRGPYPGVLARFDFSAPDMTGINLSSYVYSKLIKGEFTRLPFKAGK